MVIASSTGLHPSSTGLMTPKRRDDIDFLDEGNQGGLFDSEGAEYRSRYAYIDHVRKNGPRSVVMEEAHWNTIKEFPRELKLLGCPLYGVGGRGTPKWSKKLGIGHEEIQKGKSPRSIPSKGIKKGDDVEILRWVFDNTEAARVVGERFRMGHGQPYDPDKPIYIPVRTMKAETIRAEQRGRTPIISSRSWPDRYDTLIADVWGWYVSTARKPPIEYQILRVAGCEPKDGSGKEFDSSWGDFERGHPDITRARARNGSLGGSKPSMKAALRGKRGKFQRRDARMLFNAIKELGGLDVILSSRA